MRLFSDHWQLARTPSERYRQILHDEEIESPSPQDTQRYHTALENLSAIMTPTGAAWQIEGGLAVAMHCGRFLRRHADVDASVFEDQLGAVERRLVECGYRLFSRNYLHILEYLPWDVLQEVTSDEVLRRRRVKRLTAIHVDAGGRVCGNEGPLPRFDLHVHRMDREVVWLDRGRVAFPRDLFDQTCRAAIDERSRVTIASLPLMYFYKLAGKRQRHRYDLSLIEQHPDLSPADRRRVFQLFADKRGQARRVPSVQSQENARGFSRL